MSRVGGVLRSLRARLHKVCGWLTYRLGWCSLARAQYERVLVHTGGDFGAYIHLGRIAFDQGDYAGWRREFEHARRLDPVRFARLHLVGERLGPRLAGTSFQRPGNHLFDATGNRATWNSAWPRPELDRSDDELRADGSVNHGRHGQPQAGLPNTGLPNTGLHQEPFRDPELESLLPSANAPFDAVNGREAADDCSSADERRRLSALGPIRPAELLGCDLDDLARRLLG